MVERHQIRATAADGSTAEIDLTTTEPGSVTLLRALLSAAGFEIASHDSDITEEPAPPVGPLACGHDPDGDSTICPTCGTWDMGREIDEHNAHVMRDLIASIPEETDTP